MRKTWDTLEEAGRILGKTAERVQYLVDQGIIQVNDKGLVSHTDVVDIREALDSNKKIVDKKDVLADILVRLARLERLVAGICRTAGHPAASGFHHLNDREIYTIYADAVRSLKQEEWSEDELMKWANIFSQIIDVDLTRIAGLSGNHHPWKVFASLCSRMIAWVQDYLGVPDVRMSEVAFFLQKGRKSLTAASVLYIYSSDRSPERMVDQYFAAEPIKRLVDTYLPRK